MVNYEHTTNQNAIPYEILEIGNYKHISQSEAQPLIFQSNYKQIAVCTTCSLIPMCDAILAQLAVFDNSLHVACECGQLFDTKVNIHLIHTSNPVFLLIGV